MTEINRATSRRGWLQLAATACVACAALLTPGHAAAQQWPTKPVKIVIAVAAGSSGDLLARMLAQRLEPLWKQPVIVENKPGASGLIGTEYVARSADGHTILLGTQSSILPKFTMKTLTFDPLTDIVPVYKVVNYQLVIATGNETARKAGTLQDLIALSKSGREGLFFSGMGPTSIFNLTMAVLNKSLDLTYTAVDFSNVGAMNMAVLRNDAQFLVNTPSSIQPQFEAGQMKPLAAINDTRYPNLPDVPTLRESVAYNGYLPLLWAGIFVPKNTPATVVDRLSQDLASLGSDDEFKKAVEERLSATMVRSSPDAFAKELAKEVEVWKDLFASMNYRPE